MIRWALMLENSYYKMLHVAGIENDATGALFNWYMENHESVILVQQDTLQTLTYPVEVEARLHILHFFPD